MRKILRQELLSDDLIDFTLISTLRKVRRTV